MKRWTAALLGKTERVEERNVIWNILGSAIYALASMLLGAMVTRVLGADAGGVFFFAFSTFGQQMFIVAYFGMRPIHITDTKGEYGFSDYESFRRYTSAAAIALTFAYAFFFCESNAAKLVLILMSACKILDGYADCYESEFQRRGRLYLAGKSMAFRTMLTVLLFSASVLCTDSLVLACVFACLGQAAGVFLFCMLPLRAFPVSTSKKKEKSGISLFHSAKWLFLASFLDLYIFAASKFAVNDRMCAAESGYYTAIFIPTSIINLMSNFVTRPVLTKLSEAKEKGETQTFFKLIRKILLLIGGFTALSLLAAACFGIPALQWLLGEKEGAALKPYGAALLTVILGGGFYAVLNLLYYVLVILHARRTIFVIYGFCTVFAWGISGVCVRAYGINGAAASYTITMAFLTLLFAISAVRCFQREAYEKTRHAI